MRHRLRRPRAAGIDGEPKAYNPSHDGGSDRKAMMLIEQSEAAGCLHMQSGFLVLDARDRPRGSARAWGGGPAGVARRIGSTGTPA